MERMSWIDTECSEIGLGIDPTEHTPINKRKYIHDFQLQKNIFLHRFFIFYCSFLIFDFRHFYIDCKSAVKKALAIDTASAFLSGNEKKKSTRYNLKKSLRITCPLSPPCSRTRIPFLPKSPGADIVSLSLSDSYSTSAT